MVGDGGEVTNKFSELHEKLGKCHLNTYTWSLPLIILNVIGIVVIFYLRDIHQIQCLHEKYCYELNQTVPRRGFPLSGNCPWYLDIPPDCCVAFCYRLETVQDFCLKLWIKPLMHILEINIFSLNHVIIRRTKIMNNLLKVCKICTFKAIFWYPKSTKSFSIFFL